jgi:hypothetical protein
MPAVQDVIEHFVERYRAFIASFGRVQIGSNMVIELVFRYTGGNSAHGCVSFLRMVNTTVMHYFSFEKSQPLL